MELLSNKIPIGNLSSAEWNQVPQEIENVIEQTGLSLTNADLNQLGKSIANYVANSNFYLESAAANVYTLSKVGSKQAPTSYVNGMAVEFIAGVTNTALSTVNVNTIGSKNIANTTEAGKIVSGERILLKYRSSTDDFVVDVDAQVTVGTVLMWPTATPPVGYLECDGAPLSQSIFPELFSVIGGIYSFSGTGGGNFEIPDLRGRFVRGFDNSLGNDPDSGTRTDRGDGTAGDNVGTRQGDEIESHQHTIDEETNVETTGETTVAKGNAAAEGVTSFFGGSETRPINIYQMFIIKF